MDGHRGDVLQLDVAAARHLDAELRQHVVEGLHGERRLGGLVAAAIEAHHQPVTDQLVGAHAMDGRHVLEALGLGGCADQQQPGEQEHFLQHAIGSGQNGHSGLMKKRSSQPGWLASAKAPVPE